MGRRGGRDLGGAAEAGGAAEPVVERYGRIGCAHHYCNEHSTRGRDHDIAASLRGNVRNVHRNYNGRFSTAGAFTRVNTSNKTTSPARWSARGIDHERRLAVC